MDVTGAWNLDVTLPRGGERQAALVCTADGDRLTGTFDGTPITDGSTDGDELRFKAAITEPFAMTLDCTATVDGDTVAGKAKTPMGITLSFTGRRG